MIHVIIPDGYRGMIEVERRSDAPPIPSRDDILELHIPPSGVLQVSDVGPLAQWHRTQAQWADGTALPAAEGPPGSSTLVRLHTIGADDQGSAWFLVGTDSEARRALAATGWAAGPLPP